jgi:hypothetical protein
MKWNEEKTTVGTGWGDAPTRVKAFLPDCYSGIWLNSECIHSIPQETGILRYPYSKGAKISHSV